MTAPENTIIVSLDIENHYELHGQIDTTVKDAVVPVPPTDPDERYDWAQEHISPLTGTGRVSGDASYFVEVTASSNEALLPVGEQFEFGV